MSPLDIMLWCLAVLASLVTLVLVYAVLSVIYDRIWGRRKAAIQAGLAVAALRERWEAKQKATPSRRPGNGEDHR